MKYIDADKLIAKIQPYYEDAKCNARYAAETGTSSDCTKWDKAKAIYEHILRIISSLQREQPKVDIDEEIDKFMFAPFRNFDRVSGHCLVDMGDGKEWVPVFDWKITTYKRADAHFLRKFANHFYELGLNARKEDAK